MPDAPGGGPPGSASVNTCAFWGTDQGYARQWLPSANTSSSSGSATTRAIAAALAMVGFNEIWDTNYGYVGRTLPEKRTVLNELPVGAKVFAAVAAEEHEPAFALHAVAMATIERSAFVPGLFTNTSPVDIQPQMADWHMPQGRTYLGAELAALAAQPRQSSANGYWSEAYASAWPEAWDYLLYFKASTNPGLTDLPVCEAKSTPTMILYATAPCDAAQ